MKIIKAIYTFIVGDWIILSGILVALALLAVLHFVAGLVILRNLSGALLIVAVLAVLIITLSREAYSKR